MSPMTSFDGPTKTFGPRRPLAVQAAPEAAAAPLTASFFRRVCDNTISH